jgi:hypothetical protein
VANWENRRRAAEAAHGRTEFIQAVYDRIGEIRSADAQTQRRVYD